MLNMNSGKKNELSNPLNGSGKLSIPESIKVNGKNGGCNKKKKIDNGQYLSYRRKMRMPLFRGR